jgi:integrase
MTERKKSVARWWEGGTKRKRTFQRKKDRDAFTAKRLRRLALGDTPVATPDITLSVFVEEYWRLHAIPNGAALTRDGYAGRWDLHIRGHRLRQITPLVVGQLAVDLRPKGVGAPTIRLTLLTLQGILSLAVRQERIASNPVSKVKKPKPPALRDVSPVAPVTVERLRGRLAPWDATIASVFAYAGLRPHDLRALAVDDLGQGHLLAYPTKTGRRRRGTPRDPARP